MSECCCCFPKFGRSRQGRGLRLQRRKRKEVSEMPVNSTVIAPEVPSGGVVSVGPRDMPSSSSGAENQNVRDITDLSAEYQLRYCGMLKAMSGLPHSDEDHIDLINTLDQSQIDGQFIFANTQDDYVLFNLSKHGIKVMEAYMPSPRYMRWRHSLLEIIRAVHYEDYLNRTYLAVKLGQLGEEFYDCLLFQCAHPGQATQICKFLNALFDTVCQGGF